MAVLGYAGGPHADAGALAERGAVVFRHMQALPELIAARGR